MGVWKGDKVCLLTLVTVLNVFYSLWQKLDFDMEQQLFMPPVRVEYAVPVLLANYYNCIYPSHIAHHFNLDPPTVEEYLQNIDV